MRALTIHGPWAWAIANGHKTVENRSWAVAYRGPLAIHAGLSDRSDEGVAQVLTRLGIAKPARWPRGVVLAVVDLVDVRPVEDVPADGVWVEGPYCWMLANVQPLPDPVPCGGRQLLWRLPADIETRVLAQIKTPAGVGRR